MENVGAALLGGALIGTAVSLMLLWNGRVTGISGIVSGALFPAKSETAWRWFFLLGLFVGGALLRLFRPIAFTGALNTEMWTVALAGLLVGFGTLLGSGCTSGHGVCGVSRLSLRSLIATLIFISAGILSVALMWQMGVL